MNATQTMLVAATICGALALWQLLPRRGFRGRRWGGLLGLVSLGLLGSQVPLPGGPLDTTVFITLAVVTVGSAVCAVTFRSPVYCAVWFGLTLLGVAGLFLFQGAQFLSVATVTVYAGAILVMFLFVLMLSDPKGRTNYDRLSWEAILSASGGAVLVGVLSMILVRVYTAEQQAEAAPAVAQVAADAAEGEPPAPPPPTWQALTDEQRQAGILDPRHVAQLGGRLFSRYLVAVEAAGGLLFIALVGATAIMAQRRYEQVRRSQAGHG